MKSLLLAFLLLPSTSALFAQAKLSKAAQALVQIEHEWSDADVKKDVATLNRIMADDWTGIDFQGAVLTKAQALGEVAKRSAATGTSTTTLGDMKIRIFSNTAVVSGTEVETSQYRGNDSSGQYIWTDVFVLRKGRWQAVSSQSTKLVAQQAPDVLAQLAAHSVASRSVR